MELNKEYIIRIELNGRILTFTKAEVIENNDKYVTFIDNKTRQPISYNHNVIVSYEPYKGVDK